jgi:hypothetical protein
MTSSVLEPVTFRLVAYPSTNYATTCPYFLVDESLIFSIKIPQESCLFGAFPKYFGNENINVKCHLQKGIIFQFNVPCSKWNLQKDRL